MGFKVSKAELNELEYLAFRNNAIYVPTGFSRQAPQPTDEQKAYFNLYLLNAFGIVLTNPEKVSINVIEGIENFMPIDVPASFYENPQDLKYFSCDELLIEQLVSYFTIEMSGTHDENTNFNRVEIFEKALPKHDEDIEIKIRYFTVLDNDSAERFFTDLAESYLLYTRPYNNADLHSVAALYRCGVVDVSKLRCKDNIFSLAIFTNLEDTITMTSLLDAKDVVKYSKNKYGYIKNLSKYYIDIKNEDKFLPIMLANCKILPEISKKQAKGFNALCKLFGIDRRASYAESPERLAKIMITMGDIVGAAKLYAKHGSMLVRHLRYLISRATDTEIETIMDLLPDSSVSVLIQTAQLLAQGNDKPRTFVFTKNCLAVSHTETETEVNKRMSKLSEELCDRVIAIIKQKIMSQYSAWPKLGKLYISPEFKQVAVPINISANGVGLDVRPTGSRIAISGNYIRTFCFWKGVFDIDASCLVVNNDGIVDTYYWGNYASKKYGDSLLCSGDARGKDGAEYCDMKLDELQEKGVKYIVYTLNGYGGSLDKGEIFCGYQDKGKMLDKFTEDQLSKFDVDTHRGLPVVDEKALQADCWNPRNMEFLIQVNGNTRSYIGFAINIEKREVITLNLLLANSAAVVSNSSIKTIERYLDKNYLSVNMFDILLARAESVVETPEEADYVFDSTYTNTNSDKEQTIIRPGNTTQLFGLI
ncbi:MAG: hypothetical protein J6W64_00980 [Bacilli bacterium]|nr:hypothetical protein [Bacilli bacterium]